MESGLLQPETLESIPPNQAICSFVIMVIIWVIRIISMANMGIIMVIMRLGWITASYSQKH